MKPNVYLGIDGVILTKGVIPALYLDRFLKTLMENFNVSWLSSRCRGDVKATDKYLSQFLPPSTMLLVKKIKPTNFILDRTEAIDFSKEFFWLDRELFDSEANTLKKHNKYNSWIELNLMDCPNQLLNLMNNRTIFKKRRSEVS